MKRRTIVVVEDNPLSRLVALDACERAGFDVADFATADEAVSYTERMAESIAALVTDVDMAGERDGVDFATACRERWPDIGVLVTSGHFGSKGPEGLSPEIRFIAKPWTAKELQAEIQAVLGVTASPPSSADRASGGDRAPFDGVQAEGNG